jgi:hypothetical protein
LAFRAELIEKLIARHADVLKRPDNQEGFFTFDLTLDGREYG